MDQLKKNAEDALAQAKRCRDEVKALERWWNFGWWAGEADEYRTLAKQWEALAEYWTKAWEWRHGE